MKDSKNNVVASTTAVNSANYVMYALTDKNETYSLYINDVIFVESSEPIIKPYGAAIQK